MTQDCFECTHYDLVVIGAGPNALALVTRLLERWPSSVISDTEHDRLHHLHSGKSHKSNGLDNIAPLLLNDLNRRILVIDKYGEWMAKWDKSFKAYDIEYLRSPLFFHMDPGSPEALRAFAHSRGRANELHDITHLVDNCKNHHGGSKKKKCTGFKNLNHADREQFYTPGTELFSDFCTDLIHRYNLYDMVVQGICTKVEKKEKGFEITYSCGEAGCLKDTIIYTDALVCAIGNTNMKKIPDFVKEIKNPFPFSRISHASDFIDCLSLDEIDHLSHGHLEIIPKSLQGKLSSHQNASLVVVGGGLTAAQMVHKAVKRGFTNVKLIMRSSLKVRQFDFSLDLMGRNSGRWLAKFWMERNHKSRLHMIQKERNGGSITPEYAKILENYVNSGILQICQNSGISNCEWISSSKDIEEGIWEYKMSDNSGLKYQCDQIWLATGSVYDIFQEPVFKDIAESYNLRSVNGLPILDDNLRIHKDLEFYVMGGYASLTLGPTAANLLGGRVGAERIASKLLESWTDGSYTEEGSQLPHRSSWTMADVAANMGNYFNALAIDE